MNYEELQHIIEHIKNTYKCIKCKEYFEEQDINVLACTPDESLLELRCPSDECQCTTIVTACLTPQVEITEQQRTQGSISKNDILDIKNFLSKFDGDFKRIFKKK